MLLASCSEINAPHGFRADSLRVKAKREHARGRSGSRAGHADPTAHRPKDRYIFPNENGGALHQSDVLPRSLHPILKELGLNKQGFHGFRRFRITHLRKQRVPENLLRFWIGHANQNVTHRYDQVRTDIEFRRSTAASVGLGFDISQAKIETKSGVLYPVADVVPRKSKTTVSATATLTKEKMVRPERFELPTFWFVARRSIQLS
jgi:hypothetical protein